MTTAGTTTYRVETVYAIDDRASAALGGIGGAADRAGRSTSALTGTLSRLAGVAAGGFGLQKAGQSLIGFNANLEQSRITIAGLLQLNKPGEAWADNMGRAERLTERFQVRMKAAVGTTQDAVNMAGMIVNPVMAAGASMKQLEDMTIGAVVAAKSLGIQSEVAALDIQQAIAGTLTSRERFARSLLEPMGFTTDKFNALGAAKRMEVLSKALSSDAIKSMSKAQEQSFDGSWSTFVDNLQQGVGKVGLPLFKALTAEVRSWNAWIDANQDKVAAFAKTLSDGLVTGFRMVKDAVGFLVDHRETLLSIGKVWAAAKIAGAGADLLGGLGGIRDKLFAKVGGTGRDGSGRFTAGGVGAAGALGPVAAAGMAGWELGRVLDEQTGAGRALVNAWDRLTGSTMEAVFEAEERSARLNAANEELQRQIRAAAARFAGKGGALETGTSAGLAGSAQARLNRADQLADLGRGMSDFNAQLAAAGPRSQNWRGGSNFYLAAGLPDILSGIERARGMELQGRHGTATKMTDELVGKLLADMNAKQKALIDIGAGTNRIMLETNRRLAAGLDPLSADEARKMLLESVDKDAFKAASKRPANINIGTLKVEVSAKDPDRWIHEAVQKGIRRARRAPLRPPTALDGGF